MIQIKTRLILFLIFSLLQVQGRTQNGVTEKAQPGAFPLVTVSGAATLVVADNEPVLVKKAAALLSADIEKTTGVPAPIASSIEGIKGPVVIIGSLGNSGLLQQLVAAQKLKTAAIKGKWEAFGIQVVQNPFKGIGQALVIAGSDRRGTAYGVVELSRQMGVSPWWWWADVPVRKKKELYVTKQLQVTDAPKVQYRGIFINDEAPALSGWAYEKFGGFNHRFYEKVFELMLRLKANYLWPAMWGNAFYDDDSLNKKLADDYGIVIGTSHHEPLMRAHDEWRRYGKGKWNYDSNAAVLRQFWKKGMQRADNEKIVSIGMRGDGDEPMSRETATALLERIVKDQRSIIAEVTGKPAEATPQLWALYKEVQDYYDKGMRVPDDVTLLLCDDNWGNIRRLPKPGDKPRKGGYGIYYHFDYVGGPRNYKWINTNNMARVWEQMHLAWAYGARKIWIVNVGDIKPMEFPTTFFLDYAWNPDHWNEDNLEDYYTLWAAAQFGTAQAKEIGSIIQKYSQFNARRKPELLSPETYSLTTYSDWHTVMRDYEQLLADAEKIRDQLPEEYLDAYFQLVLHPVTASANLHELYYTVARNRYAAAQKNSYANVLAEQARTLYRNDSMITVRYHKLKSGKWNHMMAQTHIGYTYWQQPDVNKMPEVFEVPKDSAVDEDPPPISFIKSAENMISPADTGHIFYESQGYVSMEAAHWTRVVNGKTRWKRIPGIGRTGDGITTFPVTIPENFSAQSPYAAYDFYTYDSGMARIHLYFSPTLNIHNNQGLKYAVSVDNDSPQVISINKDDKDVSTWEGWVANNIIIKTTRHNILKPGKHTLKFWRVSPAVVLQKLVIDFGGLPASYLGPPETKKQLR